jgi:hypothetical protein
MKNFSKLCTPARIYFAIAVIAAVFALLNGATMMMEFWKIIFAFGWTFLLGWLCDKGYTSISWFLVLLPYIIMLLAMLNVYHISEEQRQLMRMVKLQGAYGREPFVEGKTVMKAYYKPTSAEAEAEAKEVSQGITGGFKGPKIGKGIF